MPDACASSRPLRGRTNVTDCFSAVNASNNGSVITRLMCIPIQSTYEYKTREEEQRHCLREVKPMHKLAIHAMPR